MMKFMDLGRFSCHYCTSSETQGRQLHKIDTNWSWQCKNLMYCKKGEKGVVYKLHAGWFINRTPGELKNRGLLLNIKVFSVEILEVLRKEGKFNTKFLAARQFIVSPTQAASEVLQNRKNIIHLIITQTFA